MATRPNIATTGSDEILFQNDGVSLCLLVNRHAGTLRVVDFRSGPHPAKRLFVMSLARREGVERVYTLVERDEVSTWARLGFQREGSIPAFYKRSDAFILGALVEDFEDRSHISGVQPIAAIEGPEALVERTYAAAKQARQGAGRPFVASGARAARARSRCQKGLMAALRARRALTSFEPFGRDVERYAFTCTARGGFSLMISVESQPCFNNAFIELLTAPRTEKESLLTIGAIRQLCDELFERDIVGCFALSPVDDVELACAFAMNGFRRTGLLRGHLKIGRTAPTRCCGRGSWRSRTTPEGQLASERLGRPARFCAMSAVMARIALMSGLWSACAFWALRRGRPSPKTRAASERGAPGCRRRRAGPGTTCARRGLRYGRAPLRQSVRAAAVFSFRGRGDPAAGSSAAPGWRRQGSTSSESVVVAAPWW